LPGLSVHLRLQTTDISMQTGSDKEIRSVQMYDSLL
jgi:hypothetical protein